MKIELIDINKITPYAQNPRHNQVSVAKVAASIKEFGWQQPIVVDNEMVIIAGHTRLLAAKKLGLHEVPVYIASDLSSIQVQAYRIADNRLHEDASWNNELLSIELDKIKNSGFDLELIGFNPQELESLLDKKAATDAKNAKEFSSSDFDNFTYKCPKCNFEWD